MARLPKSAAIEQIASTDLTTLSYKVPLLVTSTAFLVLTNMSETILELSVYINDGEADFLLTKSKIPAGKGKDWFVKELSTQKLNEGFTIKVLSETGEAFNSFLSVSEISSN